MRALPWALHSLKVAATGGFAFMLPPGTSRPPLTVAGETLRGAAHFPDTPVPLELQLTADSISATRSGVDGPAAREMNAAMLELSSQRPDMPPGSDAEPGLDLSLHLIDVSAQALDGNPLGGTITDTTLHAKLMGPLPASIDGAGLKAWRDAGGTIEVPSLAVRWGPLGLSGNGTVALDSRMQPEAAFAAHLTGHDKAIDALAAAGWLKPSAASIAKLALGVASRPGPDGQPAVDTPVTIQNSHISLGPVKVGDVPALQLD